MTIAAVNLDAVVPLQPYQRAAVLDESSYTWHNWSRQIGKSFAAMLRADLRLIGIGPGLRPRVPRDQIVISASERQSAEAMEKARQFLKAMSVAFEGGEGYELVDGTKYKRLEIRVPGGRKMIGLPASAATSVGFCGDVVFDEFAKHRDNRTIWRDLFPTISSIPDGCIDIWSTPEGKQDMFYQLRDNDEFSHATVTIEEAVRQGLKRNIEKLRRAYDDEDFWRSQFMCEFIDEATAFLTLEMITALEDDSLRDVIRTDEELERFFYEFTPEGRLFAGYDVGRHHDLAVIWLWEELYDTLFTRAVIVMDRVRFRRQQEIWYRTLRLPNMRRGAIDAHGMGETLGEASVEDFGDLVLPVKFTQQLKSTIAHYVRTRAEDRRMRIPSDMKIRNAWHSIRKTVTSAGNILFNGERNKDGHADEFWAAGLGVFAAHEGSGICVEPNLSVGAPVAAASLRGSGL